MFTQKEREYLTSGKLARIATVSADGQPDVTPVGFSFDGQHFYIGGLDMPRTRKYKNVRDGNQKVSLVIDDLASVDPWRPRGIRVYGEGEVVEGEAHMGSGTYLKVTPTVSWSWNIEEENRPGSARKTEHRP